MVYNNKVFHLLNPNLVNVSKLKDILAIYNVNINFVDTKEFDELIRSDEDNKFLENFVTDLNYSYSLNYDSKIQIDDELTMQYLKNAGFLWPIISNRYLELFIKNILED